MCNRAGKDVKSRDVIFTPATSLAVAINLSAHVLRPRAPHTAHVLSALHTTPHHNRKASEDDQLVRWTASLTAGRKNSSLSGTQRKRLIAWIIGVIVESASCQSRMGALACFGCSTQLFPAYFAHILYWTKWWGGGRLLSLRWGLVQAQDVELQRVPLIGTHMFLCENKSSKGNNAKVEGVYS